MGLSPPTGFNPYVPPQCLSAAAPPMGFPPLQRLQHRESALPRSIQPRHVPASGFCTLLPVYSSQRLPGLFHPGNALGVPPFRGFPSQGAAPPYFGVRLALVAFVPYPPMAMVSAGGGRSRPAHLEFAAEPSLRLQGLKLPGSPCATAIAFTLAVRRSPPGLLPPYGVPRIQGWDRFRRPFSHALLQARCPKSFPLGVQPVSAPESCPPDTVALPLSRPPDRYEVSRPRRSRLLEILAALAYRFASSHRWRLRSL